MPTIAAALMLAGCLGHTPQAPATDSATTASAPTDEPTTTPPSGVAPPSDGPLAPPALTATYAYTFLTNGGKAESGTLALATVPPTPRLDRDGAHRLAVGLRFAWDYQGGAQTCPDDAWMRGTVWLDAGLRVVRVDGGANVCLLKAPATADWRPQGGLPPFGFAWSQLLARGPLRQQLDGAWSEVALARNGGWTGPAPTALGSDFAANPSQSYRLDGKWLPAQVRLTLDPFLDAGFGWLNRTSYTEGAPLPRAEAWPIDAYAGGSGSDAYLPGEGDLAFGMGVSHRVAFDKLVETLPQAKQDLAAGCLLDYTASMGGYARTELGVVSYEADRISFVVGIAFPGGQVHDYRVTYDAPSTEAGPVQAGSTQGSWDARPLGNRDAPGVHSDKGCAPPPKALATPLQTIQAAWRLPTPNTGVPCGLSYTHTHHIGPAGVAENGDPLYLAWLAHGPETSNRGRDLNLTRLPSGYVGLDARSGHLALYAFAAEDLPPLDDPVGAQARPFPVSDPVLPGGVQATTYRCVQPPETE